MKLLAAVPSRGPVGTHTLTPSYSQLYYKELPQIRPAASHACQFTSQFRPDYPVISRDLLVHTGAYIPWCTTPVTRLRNDRFPTPRESLENFSTLPANFVGTSRQKSGHKVISQFAKVFCSFQLKRLWLLRKIHTLRTCGFLLPTDCIGDPHQPNGPQSPSSNQLQATPGPITEQLVK